MGEQMIIQCNATCHCHPLQLDMELLRDIFDKNEDTFHKLIEFKVMLGFCHEEQKPFLFET